MNKLLYIIILLTISIHAKSQNHKVEILNANIEKKENTVVVEFEVRSDNFPSDYSIEVTPVIFNGNGNWEKLESLKMIGKRLNLSEKRMGISGNHQIMKKKNNEPVFYSCSFPYSDWMQYVSLSVEQTVEGCCYLYEYPLEPLLTNILLNYQIIPHFDIKLYPYELTELEKYDLNNPFLHPMEDYSKRYNVFTNERTSGASALLFKVGSHQIDTSFEGNREVLEAINKAFELIETDPNAILKHIVIAGYASPEGSLAYNTLLGQRRAEAVKAYIETLMKQPDNNLFEMYNGREDWIGLKQLIENSEMPEKYEILNIVDSYTIEQEIRKNRLKTLQRGVPYKYMLENFYPQLRTAGYIQIYYDIKRSSNGAKIITDELGRMTWIDTQSSQNRIVTTINKAMELIVDENYNEALDILLEFSDDSRLWNNIGVCYMMTGKYEKAELFFKKALEDEDENAKKNLAQIKWIRKLNN